MAVRWQNNFRQPVAAAIAANHPPCPICGDPNVYPLWIDSAPPVGCPEGEHIKAVTECQTQMARARQQAEMRRACPEAYDESGNIKPGRLNDVLAKMPPDFRYIPAGGVLASAVERNP